MQKEFRAHRRNLSKGCSLGGSQVVAAEVCSSLVAGIASRMHQSSAGGWEEDMVQTSQADLSILSALLSILPACTARGSKQLLFIPPFIS